MIGGKSPSEYLEQLQTHKSVRLDDRAMDSILISHCLDPIPLRGNDFDKFIDTRRRLLLEKISAVMGKEVVETGEQVAEDESDEE
jgi:hypothetical protein